MKRKIIMFIKTLTAPRVVATSTPYPFVIGFRLREHFVYLGEPVTKVKIKNRLTGTKYTECVDYIVGEEEGIIVRMEHSWIPLFVPMEITYEVKEVEDG